ncbi:hypothetical protein K353_06684, partial [Kitasatospora sp. SolWspMP-SS2h]|uniref:hypothetical protein n=1 Tax=Kitasatospora sp. SolWspMP-SS2h TaxID=1305729 RepID=UPI000DBFABC5
LATINDNNQEVRIWDPTTRTQKIFDNHANGVRAMVAFTISDGTPRLATLGEDDQTVQILDPVSTTVRTLYLAERVHALTELHGLLIATTNSGYLAIDISSIPADTK